MNRNLHIKIAGRKRKLEHDSEEQVAPCTKLAMKLETYTNFLDNSTFKLIHGETKEVCFKCHEDSFDCNSRGLINVRLPTETSNVRLTVALADETSYKKENLFMSFKFQSTMANPAVFNEAFILKLIFVVIVLAVIYLQNIVKTLPSSGSKDRDDLLALIRRQLILQTLMDAPFYFTAYFRPTFIK